MTLGLAIVLGLMAPAAVLSRVPEFANASFPASKASVRTILGLKFLGYLLALASRRAKGRSSETRSQSLEPGDPVNDDGATLERIMRVELKRCALVFSETLRNAKLAMMSCSGLRSTASSASSGDAGRR